MYLKKAKRPNGRIYLTIAEGVWKNGKNQTRHVEAIGYLDELISKDCPDPIAYWTKEIKKRNEERKEKFAPAIIKLSTGKKIDKRKTYQLDLGAAIPSKYFHYDLGIWDFFDKKRLSRKFEYDPCRIMELLVFNRLTNPSSKKQAWENRIRFPRKCNFSLDDVYRCLTYFNDNNKQLIKYMNQSIEKTRGKRNKTKLYYDVTNYYFEIENEDDFRMRGVSKEHRPNPIVQMGLMLDTEGIPLDYEIFPGNHNDMTTLLPVMKKANLREEKERMIVVADKGLNTSTNIATCILDNNGYIFSQSVRKATKELKQWVTNEDGYKQNESGTFKIKSRQSYKTVRVKGEDGKTHSVKVPVKEIAFWSKDYFERSRYERSKVIEKSKAAIDRNGLNAAKSHSGIKYAKDNPYVEETGEVARHNWQIDEGKISADEKLDGYYCIVTSETGMDEKEVIEAYRGLWRIEESFHVLKSDFDARPVYVSTEDHIRAHFLICYISLLIMRLIQKDLNWKYTASEISQAIKNIIGHNLDSNLFWFDYRTELTDALGKITKLDFSKEVLKKVQINQYMSKSKNFSH